MIVWLPPGQVQVYAGGPRPDWCSRCMTSSAVRIRFYLVTSAAVQFAGLWWACQVCDPHRFGGDGDGPAGDAGAPALV